MKYLLIVLCVVAIFSCTKDVKPIEYDVGMSTGANNITIGYHAGDAITTGSNNLIIGHDIDVPYGGWLEPSDDTMIILQPFDSIFDLRTDSISPDGLRWIIISDSHCCDVSMGLHGRLNQFNTK